MIRTILWYIFFWLYLLASVFLSIPLIIFMALRLDKLRDGYTYSLASSWAVRIIRAAGGRVTVHGTENIPDTNCICFIANHQGGFDIPLMQGYMPRLIGFIAKKELRLIPILGLWMHAIGCIFIDRSDKRGAVAVINKGAEHIRSGHPMVIFPEGTRSRGNTMNRFKSGSLKLPIRAGATIIPVTINGSYKMKEAHGGLITPAEVILTVHKPVDASLYREDQTGELADLLSSTIQSAL